MSPLSARAAFHVPATDLRLAEEDAQLVDDGGLDLARGDAADRAGAGAVLQHCLADVVAVLLTRVPRPSSVADADFGGGVDAVPPNWHLPCQI